ncbi:heparinase II/III family protein [Polymorphobacter fuscus]|nr:heparinase II/III family protein [Polymorphobacter fuscus]NJC09026.1 putative heparinase superfamily protein [Polymorphobacter fuscus]
MARKTGPAPPPEAPAATDDEGERRLLRVAGDRGLSLTERLAARVSTSLYRTPLHRLRLRGRYPLKLLGVPQDPIPGDAAIGERLVAGRMIHAGHMVMTRDLSFSEAGAPPAWQDWANGWEWLRDLAAATDARAGAAVAEPLVARWLARFGVFDAAAWRADVTGTRLLFALGHAPLVLSSSDQVYRSLVLSAMATWARHLDRAAFRLPDGLPRARALCGLYAAGLLIPGGEARAAVALAGLDTLLAALVLPDGGIVTRAPVDALALAELLLFTAAAAPSLGVRPAPLFADTLARLVPSLRGLALGDAMIGGWHGGAVIGALPLERLAKRAATGTEISRAGRWSGYHRLSAGKTILVIDAGPPPPARVSRIGHAGTLAFEMSDGADRLVTNCGGTRGLASPLPAALADGLRTTAAHSTLTIADTNSTRIREDGANKGALGLGVEEVVVQTRHSEEGHWIEASHDGYARRFGMTVRRRLFLSPDGEDVRGEDTVEPAPRSALQRRVDRAFDIRFHLGPGVAATPTADGAGALLKLPAGRVWAMKARFGPGGGLVTIEPSLWIDADGHVHRTVQLVISARTEKAAASIGWSFKRAGK